MLTFETVVPTVRPLDRTLTAISAVQKMTPQAYLYVRQLLLAYAAVRAGHTLRKVNSFWEGMFLKDILCIGSTRFVLPDDIQFRENHHMEILRLIRSRQFLDYVISVEALPELQTPAYMTDQHVTSKFISLLIRSDNGRALIQAIIGHRIFMCLEQAPSVNARPPRPAPRSRHARMGN